MYHKKTTTFWRCQHWHDDETYESSSLALGLITTWTVSFFSGTVLTVDPESSEPICLNNWNKQESKSGSLFLCITIFHVNSLFLLGQVLGSKTYITIKNYYYYHYYYYNYYYHYYIMSIILKVAIDILSP